MRKIIINGGKKLQGEVTVSVGQFDTVLPMLREIHFPEELVVNASRENLITVLKEHQKPVADLLEGSKEE